MKALIFNSGLGNRMGDFTRTHHKSMARLSNGEPIFGRQLRLLAAHGITDVVVTTGPHAEQLREVAAAPQFAGMRFTFVPNDVYDQTNYIYSMYLAREHLDDDVLMLHGDLVFNDAVLSRLLADPRPDLGAVNHDLPQPEKDFKARIAGEVIREVSITAFGEDCVTFQPLYKLSRRAIGVWLDRVAAFVDAGNTGVYAENALNEVWEQAQLQLFSYAGDFVNEVDNLEDLASVSAEIRLFDAAEQPVLSEPDDYRRIPELLAAVQARRPLIVGGRSYQASLVRPYFDEHLETVLFSGYSANPKLEEVQAGLRLFHEQGCDSIISLGGGSAMDVAKCIKLLAAGDGESFPAFGDPLSRSVPHLAIPTTAGTGSEATHFAVVYIDGEKHSIAHDAALPEWVLLEPRLLASLPEYHKKASLLDAIAQCVESIWAASATERSRAYAEEGLALILANVLPYFHKGVAFDAEVTRRIQLGAHLSGKAINLTKTTAPHAMSYGLTSRYGIAHGHAAALCLRGVWRLHDQLVTEGDPRGAAVAESLDRITRVFGSRSNLRAIRKFDVILELLQLVPPRLSDPGDLESLVGSVNAERLGNSPVPLTSDDLRLVYEFLFELREQPYLVADEDGHPEDPAAYDRRGPDGDPESLNDNEDDRDDSPGGLSEMGVGIDDPYEDVRRLQAYDMEIVRAFDRFCTEHGLRYYLSEGSILGAIRHGGFIPWDDDVDVMMPRADYRRFIELGLAGKLPEGLNLDSFETNPKHWVFGAKLQLMRATEFVLPKVGHLAHHNGPYLDVFPVDAVAATSGPKFKAQALLLRTLRRALFMSSGRSRGLRKNPVGRIPLYLLTQVIPTPVWHRWIVWAQSEFNSSPEATHWANLCTYYPLEREVFPKEWFGEGRRVPFEGTPIPVPAKAERMLKRIYGPTWAEIPGLQVRNTRSHAFRVDRALAAELRQPADDPS